MPRSLSSQSISAMFLHRTLFTLVSSVCVAGDVKSLSSPGVARRGSGARPPQPWLPRPAPGAAGPVPVRPGAAGGGDAAGMRPRSAPCCQQRGISPKTKPWAVKPTVPLSQPF